MKRDTAVSPVIAVILMVAITVVLAAVVYTWVSGFGQGNTQARTIGLMSEGSARESNASYTVSSATSGLQWRELQFTLDGNPLSYANLTASEAAPYRWCLISPGGWCYNAINRETVDAGDRFFIQHTDVLSGARFVVVDVPANSAIATLTVR